MISTTPAFNLKVVLKETGLAADTLRAWERRYGLPVPQRTTGGHRLYSQRDIETIKWLMKRQAEGLSISRAVDLWNEQLTSGGDPLAGALPTGLAHVTTEFAHYQGPDTTLDTMRAHWVEACLNFNESNAEQSLSQAFSIFPVEAVCIEVIQKGMSEIGDLWYENQASVQQEHFASGLAVRRLDALLSASPAPTRNQTILIGCPPNEWHTFAPLLLTLLLRRRGWNVIYLGANVPAEQFSTTVKDNKADLVVLAAQQLITAASLQQITLALWSQDIPVGFGGRIFNLQAELPSRISGFFLGRHLSSAVDEIEVILNKRIKLPQARAASAVHLAAYQAFLSRRGQIELTFREWMEPLPISLEEVRTGIYFLGENLTAALQLGDVSLVSGEVEWLKILLQSHTAQPEQLIEFMETYSTATNKHIGAEGRLILNWFAVEVAKLRTESG